MPFLKIQALLCKRKDSEIAAKHEDLLGVISAAWEVILTKLGVYSATWQVRGRKKDH